MSHTDTYMAEAAAIASGLDAARVEELVGRLTSLRETSGRLFLVGVGGSAGNCSHAANDFRKLCGIDALSLPDNVSEITARTNDEGWETVFSETLRVSHAGPGDALFVLSVGGGDERLNVSVNLIRAIDYCRSVGMPVYGIVGKSDGYTARMGDCVVVIPVADASRVTPHSEAFQAVVWHCMVSHPDLQVAPTKWESATDGQVAGVTKP